MAISVMTDCEVFAYGYNAAQPIRDEQLRTENAVTLFNFCGFEVQDFNGRKTSKATLFSCLRSAGETPYAKLDTQL